MPSRRRGGLAKAAGKSGERRCPTRRPGRSRRLGRRADGRRAAGAGLGRRHDHAVTNGSRAEWLKLLGAGDCSAYADEPSNEHGTRQYDGAWHRSAIERAPAKAAERRIMSVPFISHLAAVLLAALALWTMRLEFGAQGRHPARVGCSGGICRAGGGGAAGRVDRASASSYGPPSSSSAVRWRASRGRSRRWTGPRPPADPRAAGLGWRQRGGLCCCCWRCCGS